MTEVSTLGRTTVWVVAAALALLAVLPLSRWQLGTGEATGIRSIVEARLNGQPERLLLESVTAPIERRLLALPSVAHVLSETSDGLVRWSVVGDATATPEALASAVERVAFTSSAAGINPAQLTVESLPSPARPCLDLFVTGADAAALGAFARGAVLPALARVRGSGRIEVSGLSTVRAVVEPRAADLNARGMTALDLLERLRGLASVAEAGRIRDGARVRPLAIDRRPGSLAELSSLTLAGPQGELRLGAVATVSSREVSDGTWASWNGQPAIRLRLYPRPGNNAGDVAERASGSLNALATQDAGSVAIHVAGRAENGSFPFLGMAVMAVLMLALAAVPLVLRGQTRWTASGLLSVPLATLSGLAFIVLWTRPPLLPAAIAGGAALGMAISCALDGRSSPAFAPRRVASAALLLGLVTAVSAPWGTATVLATALWFVVSATTACVLGSNGSLGASDASIRPSGSAADAPFRPSILGATLVLLIAGAGIAALWVFPPQRLLGSTRAHTLLVRFALVPSPGTEAVAPSMRAFAMRASAAIRASQPESEWASYTPIDAPPSDPLLAATPRVAAPDVVPGLLAWRWPTTEKRAHGEKLLRQFLARQPGVLAWVSSGAADDAELQAALVAADSPAAAAERSQSVAKGLARQGATLVDETILRQQPAIRVAWSSWLVDRAPTAREDLSQQVAAGLGNLEAGAVAIRGLEPAVWLAGTVPADLRQLPVRISTRPSGPPDRVVPLMAVARLVPGQNPSPTLHLDGRPAQRLWFAGKAGAAIRPTMDTVVWDGAIRSGAPLTALLSALALLLLGVAAAAAAGSSRVAAAALAIAAAAAAGSLTLLSVGRSGLDAGALVGTATAIALGVGFGFSRGWAAGNQPARVSPPLHALLVAAAMLGGLGFITSAWPTITAVGMTAASAEALKSCGLALFGGSAAVALCLPVVAPRARNGAR